MIGNEMSKAGSTETSPDSHPTPPAFPQCKSLPIWSNSSTEKARQPSSVLTFAGGFRGEFATFAGLAPLIGRRYTFYGVIARGTDGKLNSHDSVEEMAAAYIQQIRDSSA